MMDPLSDFGPDEPCWCDSGRKYQKCHGVVLTSDPGAPVPPDEADAIWLSPQTKISGGAIDSLLRQASGLPVYVPPPRPTQSAQRVHPVAVELAELPDRTPTLPVADIGKLRFERLSDLGLSDPVILRERLESMTTQQFDELTYVVLDLAKATLGSLVGQTATPDPPVVLWAGDEPVSRFLGRTLFWADQYLVEDPLADAMLSRSVGTQSLFEGLEKLIALRSLIELGLVVPIPSDLATAITADSTRAATEDDLTHDELVAWVDQQVHVEGPTAREALIVAVKDELTMGGIRFFLHGHIDRDSLDPNTHAFEISYLSPYRPGFDYAPWIAQSRGKVVADLLQETNRAIAVSGTFGGAPVTRVPFRARLLRHKGAAVNASSALVWADVPWLPDASPDLLAAISQEAEAVEALRARSRRAFAHANQSQDFDRVASALADELGEAARQLGSDIRTTKLWGSAGATASSLLSVGVGVTTGVVGGLLSAGIAAASSLPVIGQLREQHRRPAYALVMAKRDAEQLPKLERAKEGR